MLLRIIVHHTFGPVCFIACMNIMRRYSLTSTKYVPCRCCCSVIWSYLGTALYGNGTLSTTHRFIRHFIRHICRCWRCWRNRIALRINIINTFYPISTHSRLFTAAIDILYHLGIALNSDRTITTNQSCVAMCRNTSTSTEYTTINNRCTSSRYSSYRHLRIPFHSAYFTATIDVTIHCTVTNGNFRSFIFIFFCCEICACASIINTHHGLRAREFVSLTLTASKDVLSDSTTGDVHRSVAFHIRLLTTAIDAMGNRHHLSISQCGIAINSERNIASDCTQTRKGFCGI